LPVVVPLENEGAGNAGCALHPRSRVQIVRVVRTRAYRAAENIRHSLRNGFTAYLALTPEYRALLASVASRNLALRPGRAFAPPQDLTPTTEASGPHDFAVRSGIARLRVPETAHGVYPALRSRSAPDAAASTATPVPTFGNDGQRPSPGDGMARVIRVIWVSEKAKFYPTG
jgi:hypothetical protein